MEIKLNETQSKVVKKFEVEQDGYKVTIDLTVNAGKIENLSGYVSKLEEDGRMGMGIRFCSYKRNNEWITDVTGASNAEHDLVSDICIAIADAIIAEYEVVE